MRLSVGVSAVALLLVATAGSAQDDRRAPSVARRRVDGRSQHVQEPRNGRGAAQRLSGRRRDRWTRDPAAAADRKPPARRSPAPQTRKPHRTRRRRVRGAAEESAGPAGVRRHAGAAYGPASTAHSIRQPSGYEVEPSIGRRSPSVTLRKTFK